jgi:cupin fold WbuC family metalloprotein
MRVIADKFGNKLAILIDRNNIPNGLHFYSEEHDNIQVGTWHYNTGTLLPAHNHNFVIRELNRTQECVIPLCGSVQVELYDEQDEFVTEFKLDVKSVLICFAGGHKYRILEENTVCIEVKSGPYPGVELDRRRF